MTLQFFVSIKAETEEVCHLLENKRRIDQLPFETDVQGKYYESLTLAGEKAYLVIEESKYLNVFY